jgi:hypothetical protein
MHPVLNAEREVIYSYLNSLKGVKVDIGGDPRRHFRVGSDVWTVVSNRSASDAHRQDRYKQAEMWCDCDITSTFESCGDYDCVAHQAHVGDCDRPVVDEYCGCKVRDAYISCHTLYYYTWDEIARLTQIAPVYAAVHVFPEVEGSIHDEMFYQVTGNGCVYCKVKGSSIGYEHSSMGWLHDRNVVETSGGSFSWYLQCVIGSSAIYKFIKVEPGTIGDPPTSVTMLLRDGVYAATNLLDIRDRVDFSLDLPRFNVTYWGKAVVFGTETRSFSVSKQLIRTGRLWVVGKARTKDEFQLLLAKLREKVVREEMDIEPDVLFWAAVLIFICDVESEVKGLATMSRFLGTMGKHHTQLLNLDFQILHPTLWVYYLWSAMLHVLTMVTMIVYTPDVKTKLSFRVDGSSNATEGHHQTQSMAVEPYTTRKQRSDSNFIFSFNWKKVRTRGAQLVGLAVARRVPVMDADSPFNEETALRGRQLMEVDEPVFNVWNDMRPIVQNHLVFKTIKPVTFDEWNNPKRFPPTRVKQNLAAKAKLDSLSADDRLNYLLSRSTIRRTFIKRELLVKSSETGLSNKEPRLIQGVGHAANVVLGPWMLAFSKELAKQWNSKNRIVYASGMNAEVLGSLFDEGDRFGNYLLVDFSRYDATISKDALLFEQFIYSCFGGMDSLARDVLRAQLHPRGFTTHGHKYDVGGTRCSGDPNTSCGNSMLNAFAQIYVADRLGLNIKKLVVLGDDSVTLLDGEPDLTQVNEAFARLGFKSEAQFVKDLDLVEFCSGRFYPALSADGSETRVWAPKVGRFLAKSGWCTNVNNANVEWYKGNLTAYNVNFAHVPIARDVIKRAISLLGDVKAKGAIRDQYKIHASVKHRSCDRTYEMIERVYGVSSSDLVELRNYLTGITEFPYFMDHGVITRVLERDT